MHPSYKFRTALACAGILLVCAAAFQANAQVSSSTIPADVQAQIQARTEQLQLVNQQLQATQVQLNSIQSQKNSLQNEVKSLDTSVKQLNLNIQSDQLNSANLTDQIGSLQDQLQEIGAGIQDKRGAIAAALQALQKKDDTPFIIMLLGSDSLATGLADAQSLDSLRNQLTSDIGALSTLSDHYSSTLGDLGVKKNAVAVHQEDLQNHKAIVQDQQAARAALLVETKNQESLYQKKIGELTAQQDKLDDEISQIEAQLKAGVNPNSLPLIQEGLFSWPLESIRITQHFGEKSSLYRGKPHNGVDLAASIGTPVLAAADGLVIGVDNNDRSATKKYQYGRYVLIKHANNLTTIYAHLSRQVVSVGQTVKRGEIIGYSGKTGYATGPHLHFGVYFSPSVELKSIPPAAGLVPVGVVLNPESYLPVH